MYIKINASITAIPTTPKRRIRSELSYSFTVLVIVKGSNTSSLWTVPSVESLVIYGHEILIVNNAKPASSAVTRSPLITWPLPMYPIPIIKRESFTHMSPFETAVPKSAKYFPSDLKNLFIPSAPF